MFKGLVLALAALNLVNGAAIESRANLEDCVIKGQAPALIVGGGGGSPFCTTRWPSGDTIKKIRTWFSNDGFLSAIDLTYGSGDTISHGQGKNKGDTESKMLELATGEMISEARLWDNGKNTGIKRIRFTTKRSDGTNGEVTMGANGAGNGWPVSTGGGLLIGVAGRAGERVDQLTLLFYGSEIERIKIGNMKYDGQGENGVLNWPAPESTRDEGKGMSFYTYNDFDTPGKVTVKVQHRAEEKMEWKQATTGTFGMTFTIAMEMAIPLVFKLTASTAVTWSVSHETSTTTSRSDTLVGETKMAEKIPGHSGMICDSLYYSGTNNKQYYTTDVDIFFKDKSTVTYKEKGYINVYKKTDTMLVCSPTKSNKKPDDDKYKWKPLDSGDDDDDDDN